MRQVPALPVVGPFADRLLAADLPDLPRRRRAEAVAFVAHRVDTLPSFTRIGVLAIAGAVRVLLALPGGWAATRMLMRLPLPLVGEYPRLIRSLSFAFVWERWPDTGSTGAMCVESVA
jgi:hypothetical protein